MCAATCVYIEMWLRRPAVQNQFHYASFSMHSVHSACLFHLDAL